MGIASRGRGDGVDAAVRESARLVGAVALPPRRRRHDRMSGLLDGGRVDA